MQQDDDGKKQEGEGAADDPHSNDCSGKGPVAHLAMRAMLALGRASEAQAELLAMAAAPDAPLTLCMAAVKVRRAPTDHMHGWVCLPSSCRQSLKDCLQAFFVTLSSSQRALLNTLRSCWARARSHSWRRCQRWRRCCAAASLTTQLCQLASCRCAAVFV